MRIRKIESKQGKREQAQNKFKRQRRESTPEASHIAASQRAQCTEKRDEGQSERECLDEVRVCERVLGF